MRRRSCFFSSIRDHIHIENTIRITSIREKTSEQRRLFLESCEARCSEIVRGVIRDAVAAGDLQLSDDFGVESAGVWALVHYLRRLLDRRHEPVALPALGIHEPLLAIRDNCNRLLDGVGWKPLSSEVDLSPLVERIKQEVFAAEFAQVGRLAGRVYFFEP